ncbi:MAG: hypothetical protein JSS66_11025 [Armatimonadetes bacterium]|nr:hypothetical protein [Armatimonadota bacterium]
MNPKSYLWRRLTIPLAVATSLVLLLAWFCPLEGTPFHGLFLHLAVELAVLIVTVLYVESIVIRHDELKWEKADALVREQIARFANYVTSILRDAFDMPASVLNMDAFDSATSKAAHDEMARVAEHVLKPMASAKVKAIDQAGWSKLAEQIGTALRVSDGLFTTFGNRMRPEIYQKVLEIRTELDTVLATYTMVPDVLGVPDNELAPLTTGESGVPLKRSIDRRLAQDMERALTSVAELLKML